MSDKASSTPPNAVKTDLSEAEIAKRFEDTVRRMANTKPEPKSVKKRIFGDHSADDPREKR